MQNKILTGIIIAFVLISCKAQQSSIKNTLEEPAAIVTLDSGKWWLVKIHSQQGITEVTNRKAFIKFNLAEGRAGGNGSCNSFGSTLKLDGDKLSVTNIFSTKMYCDDVQSIENSFFSLLAKADRYEIKGNELLMFDQEKTLLEFRKE